MDEKIIDLLYEEVDDEDLGDLVYNILNLEEKKRKETHNPKGIKGEIQQKLIKHLQERGRIK